MLNKLLYFCLLLGSLQSLYAQGKGEAGRFSAEIIAGFNLAQIDGDASAGYNKIGLNAGARGGFSFSRNWQASVEILLSQMGSRSDVNEFTQVRYHLNYVSIPVSLSLRDWEISDNSGNSYMRAAASINLIPSRLLNGTVVIDGFDDTQKLDDLKPWDFAIGFSGRIYFTKNWGLELRWSRSLLSMSNTNRTIGHMLGMRALFAF